MALVSKTVFTVKCDEPGCTRELADYSDPSGSMSGWESSLEQAEISWNLWGTGAGGKHFCGDHPRKVCSWCCDLLVDESKGLRDGNGDWWCLECAPPELRG